METRLGLVALIFPRYFKHCLHVKELKPYHTILKAHLVGSEHLLCLAIMQTSVVIRRLSQMILVLKEQLALV